MRGNEHLDTLVAATYLATTYSRQGKHAEAVAELRVDRQEEPRLPSLPHELWLLVLEFTPRRELGAPPPPAV